MSSFLIFAPAATIWLTIPSQPFLSMAAFVATSAPWQPVHAFRTSSFSGPSGSEELSCARVERTKARNSDNDTADRIMSVRNGSHARLDVAVDARWVRPGYAEFFEPLTVDQRGGVVLRRRLVSSLQSAAEVFRRLDVFAPGAQSCRHDVIAQVFLEQIHVQRTLRIFSRGPDAPGVVI